MKKFFLATATTSLMLLTTKPIQAASCYDLWYERNLIYAQNGYCFSTSLAQRVFSDFSCWTKNPDLSRAEQRRVSALKAEENRRGCKVNQ